MLISSLVLLGSTVLAGVGVGDTGPGVIWWPRVTTGVARDGGELDFLPELREM